MPTNTQISTGRTGQISTKAHNGSGRTGQPSKLTGKQSSSSRKTSKLASKTVASKTVASKTVASTTVASTTVASKKVASKKVAEKPEFDLDTDADTSDMKSWERVRAFYDNHVWSESPPDTHIRDTMVSWRPKTINAQFAAVRFDGKRVLMAVKTDTTPLSGHIVSMTMETRSDSDRFKVGWRGKHKPAVRVYWVRKDEVDCDMSILNIAASPTHNVANGNAALELALALCRRFGVPSVSLYDASSLPCSKMTPDASPSDVTDDFDDDNMVPLRSMRILTKGDGWYESKGFRCIQQVLEPDLYRQHADALRIVSTTALRSAIGQFDAALRRCVLDRTEVVANVTDRGEPSAERTLKTGEVLTLLESTSATLDLFDLLDNAGMIKPTIGETVAAALRKDCGSGISLVRALLPDDSQQIDVLTIGGVEAVHWPSHESWSYVRRLSPDLTMRLLL